MHTLNSGEYPESVNVWPDNGVTTLLNTNCYPIAIFWEQSSQHSSNELTCRRSTGWISWPLKSVSCREAHCAALVDASVATSKRITRAIALTGL